MSKFRTLNDPSVFVISAPSGVGKTTVVQELLGRDSGLKRTVSHTTRPPRDGEIDGQDYHFIDKDTFERMRNEGKFLEWAEVYGQFYGTSLATIQSILKSKHDAVLVIEAHGATEIRKHHPRAVLIFLFPPDVATIHARLRKRGGKDTDIQERFENARRELETAIIYDYWVVNDALEEAVTDVASIVRGQRRSRGVNNSLKEHFLDV